MRGGGCGRPALSELKPPCRLRANVGVRRVFPMHRRRGSSQCPSVVQLAQGCVSAAVQGSVPKQCLVSETFPHVTFSYSACSSIREVACFHLSMTHEQTLRFRHRCFSVRFVRSHWVCRKAGVGLRQRLKELRKDGKRHITSHGCSRDSHVCSCR